MAEQHAFDIRQFWEARLSEHPDLTGSGALGNRLRFVELMYRARMRQVAQALRAHGLTDLTGKRVLDVGSGTGIWLEFWRRYHPSHLVGMDFAAASVRAIQTRLPAADVVQADVCEAPFPVPFDSFDLISSFEVLLHVLEPERFRRAIANLARYCAPGGWLVFSEPIVQGDGYVPTREPSYATVRPLEEYRDALAAHRLVIHTVRPTTVLLNSPLEARTRGGYRARQLWWRLCRKASPALDLPPPLGGLLWHAALSADGLACRLSRDGHGPTSKLLLAQKPPS